ncbi:MAG: hypothetical protein ABI678_23125 [Kofleriaceae bacterium]
MPLLIARGRSEPPLAGEARGSGASRETTTARTRELVLACSDGDPNACSPAERDQSDRCRRGDPQGCILLGIGCDRRARRDDSVAAWTRACDLPGGAEGCWLLGRSYFVANAEAEGFPWIRRACEQGHAPACSDLAMRYLHGEGVAADRAKAHEALARACSLGNSFGCAKLTSWTDAAP